MLFTFIVRFFFFLFITFNYSIALVGKLHTNNANQILLTTSKQTFILEAPTEMLEEIKTIIPFKTYVEVLSYKQIDNNLKIFDYPILISGNVKATGTLLKDNDNLVLKTSSQNIHIKFANGVYFRGSHFDQKSINFYINKNVNIIGYYKNNILIITAIIEADLYNNTQAKFPIDYNYQQQLDKNPISFILHELPKNEIGQHLTSFKKTIIYNSKIEPNDGVLLVSLAGREGDDFMAAPGHFAIGYAKVDKNLKIDNLEIFNFYNAKNGKGIIPGIVSYQDYFGGISTGQANYRPLYTLLIYGVDKQKVKNVRKDIAKILSYMRVSGDNGGLTNNCVNASLNALYSANISTNNDIFDIDADFWSNSHIYFTNSFPKISTSIYYLFHSKEDFMPRVAFISVLDKLSNYSPKRVDFIFQQQIPSNRPLGGIPIREGLDYIWVSKMEDQRLDNIKEHNFTGNAKYQVQWVSKELDNQNF